MVFSNKGSWSQLTEIRLTFLSQEKELSGHLTTYFVFVTLLLLSEFNYEIPSGKIEAVLLENHPVP